MRVTLGFDTSCYTTSAAAVDEHGAVVAAERMLLPVREGQRGLSLRRTIEQLSSVFTYVQESLYPSGFFRIPSRSVSVQVHRCR